MQVYANSNRVSLKTILFFIVVLLIAFLPVSSFLFSLKNDAFTGYFPAKFFMSESIHAGHLPLWNPYINFGFPQYGDMSGGYWNPVTWLIAATVGYNAYTFTLEVLFYILLSGIGMYVLTGTWITDNRIRIIAAIAYMCSGYNIGHLQHFNWLCGAAFLPWCFWSYLLLLKKFSIKNVLTTALLFYLLASSAHPGIIISSFYFFTAVLVFCFFKKDNNLSTLDKIKKWGVLHIILLVLFLLVSAGMIMGYLDILPFFVRGEKISLADSLLNPTNIKCWISAFLPFATVKNNIFYDTDISMRNCYFSLTLLLFFLLACFNKKSGWQKFLLITGLLFAFLSAGGFFKTIAYKFIPLIGYVRLNGEFRIFSLLSFIIIAAIEADKFVQQKSKFSGAIKWICYLLEIIMSAFIIAGLYKTFSTKNSFLFNGDIFKEKGISLQLKALIDAITFYDTFWLQGIVQLLILWATRRCIKYDNWGLLKKIVIADIIIASLFNIPFTGVGKTSVAQVQSILNKAPKGLPVPVLHAIKTNDSLPAKEKIVVGDWSMYNKQIGVINEVPYPIILKNMNAYFINTELKPQDNFLDKPFIFLADTDSTSSLTIKFFSADKIGVAVTTDTSTKIILQQNFYPHWFYQNGNNKMPVDSVGINFMSASIHKGQTNITFSFEPLIVKYAMFFSAVIFMIYCALLIFFSIKAVHKK